MAQTSAVDFGRTADDYASHRAGFPMSFFSRLFALDVWTGRKDVLDLGTGTGTVARGFAKKGFTVTGLDPSDNLIEAARALDQKAGVSVAYVQGTAEKTGLPAASFDAVTAGQCFHWFDKEKAPAEIKRVLRPGGLFVTAYFDWLRQPGNPVDVMYGLQKKYNPGWGNIKPLQSYPQKPGDLSFAGFTSKASFLYEEDIPYTHIGWRGRMRAYGGIGGSLPPEAIAAFDKEFAVALQQNFKNDLMLIPHKVWAEVWQLQE